MVVLLLVSAMMIITAGAARAAEEAVVENGSGGFYTWEMLATYAGCLAATILMTQFIKPVWPTGIKTQFLSYIIALALLILANLAMESLTVETAGISVLNAVVIACAANGSYDNIMEAVKPDPDADTGGDPDIDEGGG